MTIQIALLSVEYESNSQWPLSDGSITACRSVEAIVEAETEEEALELMLRHADAVGAADYVIIRDVVPAHRPFVRL